MKPLASRSAWLAALSLLAASIALAQNPAPAGAPGGPPPRGEPQAQPQQARPAENPPAQPSGPALPRVALPALVERVERSSKKSFLIDPRALPVQIYLGGMREEDVTYPTLLSILRLYGFAAYALEGHVNIVPDQMIRSAPVPMVQNDDRSIAADEYVSRIITVSKVPASGLVPVLRPLLPQQAHLAAMCGNTPEEGCHRLIVVDTYASVQRIAAIVRTLDQ